MTTTDIRTLRINGQRLWDSLMELAKIGNGFMRHQPHGRGTVGMVQCSPTAAT